MPKAVLKSRVVSREINFTSAEQIDKFRLEQRVFLKDNVIEGISRGKRSDLKENAMWDYGSRNRSESIGMYVSSITKPCVTDFIAGGGGRFHVRLTDWRQNAK